MAETIEMCNYQLLKNLKSTVHSLLLYIFVIGEAQCTDPENEQFKHKDYDRC